MAQAVPEALAAPAVRAGQAASVVLAVPEALGAQAGPAAQGELAVQADPEALAAQAGQAALAAQAVQAVLADPGAAPARRRGPLAVLLGGRTSAGREARRWAV